MWLWICEVRVYRRLWISLSCVTAVYRTKPPGIHVFMLITRNIQCVQLYIMTQLPLPGYLHDLHDFPPSARFSRYVPCWKWIFCTRTHFLYRFNTLFGRQGCQVFSIQMWEKRHDPVAVDSRPTIVQITKLHASILQTECRPTLTH
jgi:hypothetical protein